MQLSILLAEAHDATPGRRIEWRDQIAAFGGRAIEGVQPWLEDPILAAFAIRVIERAGEQGQGETAARVLRAARRVVPAHLQSDLDWALGRLRVVMRPSPPPRSLPASLSDVVPPTRDLPRFTTVARRRPR
jgi:hypothetical protein